MSFVPRTVAIWETLFFKGMLRNAGGNKCENRKKETEGRAREPADSVN